MCVVLKLEIKTKILMCTHNRRCYLFILVNRVNVLDFFINYFDFFFSYKILNVAFIEKRGKGRHRFFAHRRPSVTYIRVQIFFSRFHLASIS